MKTLIATAFEERNIDLIADYIISHFHSNTSTSLSNEYYDSGKGKFEATTSRFLSLSLSGEQKFTQRKILYEVLAQSLDPAVRVSESDDSSRTFFLITNSIGVNAIALLCQTAKSYNHIGTRKIFVYLARFVLDCCNPHSNLISAGRSLKGMIDNFFINERRGLLQRVDEEGLLRLSGIVKPQSKLLVDPMITLQNRHFEPFFTIPQCMDTVQVYEIMKSLNTTLRKKGQSPIVLSYSAYVEILSMESIHLNYIFSIFRDLKEESEMAERNILVRKTNANDKKGNGQGEDEHTARKTWGCILNRSLAFLLRDRFRNAFEPFNSDELDSELMCPVCHCYLLPISSFSLFGPGLKRSIFAAILEEKTSPQAIVESVTDFYYANLPHDQDLYVIDGLNVAYYARSRWSKHTSREALSNSAPRLHQIDAIMKELYRRGIPFSSIKIVLPRKHCFVDTMHSTEKVLLNHWRSNHLLLESPDDLSDDLFWLSYAFSHFTEAHPRCTARTYLLTNDQMRDHQTHILNGTDPTTHALFKQWKSIVQVFFDIHYPNDSDRLVCGKDEISVRLFFPPRIINGFRFSELHQRWHIPFYDDESKDLMIYPNHDQCIQQSNPVQWLCCSNPVAAESSPSNESAVALN